MSWSDLVNNIQKFFSCFSCCYKRHIDKDKYIKKTVNFTLPKDRFYYSTYTNIIVNDVSYPVYKCYGDTQSQYIKINNAYLKV
jgi:hypothetical protein